jgi:type II secretory pathway pseudopilin PulG
MQESGIPRKKVRTTPDARRAGVTVVEVVVALFILGAIMSLVMFSWTFFARSTLLQKRKSALRAQTEQVASVIVSDIGTSPRVIFFDPGGITFIASGGDTATYRLSNDSLRKNGAAIPFGSGGARVVKFAIEKETPLSVPVEQNQPQDAALVVTLGAKDRTGVTSEVRNRVTIRYTEDTSATDKRKWNY